METKTALTTAATQILLKNEALISLTILAGVGLALALLSRVWLARWLLRGLLRPAGRHFKLAYQLIRTPGNLLHETGHAVGFLITGYRVIDMRFWFNDPAERGYVLAGNPWAPWGKPLLARLVASPAPMLCGAFLLQYAARWLELPTAAISALRSGPEFWPTVGQFQLAGDSLWAWLKTPLGPYQLAAFLALAISIGIELAPSREDLHSLSMPAVVLFVLVIAGQALSYYWPPFRGMWSWFGAYFIIAANWLVEALLWTIAALLLVGILLTPLRLVISGWR